MDAKFWTFTESGFNWNFGLETTCGMLESSTVNLQTPESRLLILMCRLRLSMVKAVCKKQGIGFSMPLCKSVRHNVYMLERFIYVFGITPTPQVIDKLFQRVTFIYCQGRLDLANF